MATATKTRAKSGPAAATKGAGAGTGERRIDGRMRFAWLVETRSTYVYEGEDCILAHPGRAKPFRGPSLTAAINQGMAAVPLSPGGGGSRGSGRASRAAGK